MSATKVVTNEDLGEFYEKILPYLNGDAMSYSTSEQDTGKRWIDGKKIYQKTFSNAITLDGTTKNMKVAHSLSIDKAIRCEAIVSPSDNSSCIILPVGYDTTYTTTASADKTYLYVNRTAADGYSGQKVTFTIWYTKTTT